MPKGKLKTKIHFNRINMQRKDPRVWSAHTSKSCNPSEKIVVKHNGVTVLGNRVQPRQPATTSLHGCYRQYHSRGHNDDSRGLNYVY